MSRHHAPAHEPTTSTFTPAPTSSSLLQRTCACGGTPGPSGECASCQKERLLGPKGQPLQPKLRINRPGDALEQEADRIADAVVRGGVAGSPSRLAPASAVQRQEAKKEPPSDAEKYKEAAKKVGEAFLETDVGKRLKDRATGLGKAFWATLPGKVITGTAAVGAVSAIAASNAELPMQLPEIPLDVLTPGLSMELTYEGPVQKPTKAFISFTYKLGADKGAEKKPARTESEKFRAETARMQQEQHRFREGLKTPEQRAAEEEAFQQAFWRMKANDPLNPLGIPGLKPRDQVGPLLPKREEETPLRRKEAGPSASVGEAPPIVHEVLASSGRPLDPATRSLMEARFGHDFSRVRVHTDAKAEASAGAVGALAYTVGPSVILAASAYRPDTLEGRWLLAHELTHVIQNGAAPKSDRPGLASRPASPAMDHANPGVEEVGATARPGLAVVQRSLPSSLLRFVPEERSLIRDLDGVVEVARRTADERGALGMMRWGRFTAGVSGSGGLEALGSTSSRSGSLPARYLYTCRCGLIDMRHFYQLMYIALLEGNRSATEEGREHELKAEPSSRFAPEDTPSNALGAYFGSQQSWIQRQSTFVANLRTFLGSCRPIDFSRLSEADRNKIVSFYGSRDSAGRPSSPTESALPASPTTLGVEGCKGRTGMFPFVLAAGDQNLKTLSGDVE